MGLVDNGCLCGSHLHLLLGWLIWGMHLCCFLMGWGHSSFSIIYVGRVATSDEHFSFFLLEKTFVSWAWFRVQIRVPFWTPGVQNEGRFRDQNMDPENSWFSCAIADHIM